MADDDGSGRLSELSYDQLQRLHEQVLANWTQSDRPGSELDVLHVVGVRAALVAVYVVIIVVGILGNSLVVVVAASRRPRSTSTARSSLQVGRKRQKRATTTTPIPIPRSTHQSILHSFLTQFYKLQSPSNM